MNDTVLSIVLGIISSLASSMLYLLVIFKVRPNLNISSKIAHVINSRGEGYYSVKVINRSRFEATNLKIEFEVLTPIPIPGEPGGYIVDSNPLGLKYKEVMYLSRFNIHDDKADYAIRILSYDNLHAKWKEG